MPSTLHPNKDGGNSISVYDSHSILQALSCGGADYAHHSDSVAPEVGEGVGEDIPELTPLEQREVSLEGRMISRGVDAYRKSFTANASGGRLSTTASGINVLKLAIEPLVGVIEVAQREWASATPTRGDNTYKRTEWMLTLLEPETIAFITTRVLLDAILRQPRAGAMALAIGGALEDELRFRLFEDTAKPLYAKICDNMRTSTSYRHRRSTLRFCMTKFGIGQGVWRDWSTRERGRIGRFFLEEFVKSGNWVKIIQVTLGHNKTQNTLYPTDNLLRTIDRLNSRCELLTPARMPMVCPPVPWTTPTSGGYLTRGGQFGKQALVKGATKEYLDELGGVEMPQVYEAVNRVQATPWRINGLILDAVKAVWEMGGGLAKLPLREREPITTRPCDIETNNEARKLWRREAAMTYSRFALKRSKRISVARTLAVAEEYALEAAIYFPHALDFRGRMYPLPQFLNPQSDCLARGLLEFAEAKPLSTPEAARWLAIHGANMWGEDKTTLDDRVAWVDAHQDAILAVACDPPRLEMDADGREVLVGNMWWAKADKPWRFLAWCYEWVGYLTDGLEWESRLPVAMDGTCNGLQHLSAMLRDEDGGAATNLIPSDTPQDIYGVVAKRATELTAAECDVIVKPLGHPQCDVGTLWRWLTDGPKITLAERVCAFGITRSTAKRSVMITPYGGTTSSMRDYVQEDLEDRLETEANIFGEDLYGAVSLITKGVCTSIGETIVAAKLAMKWIRKACNAATKANPAPVSWQTPLGFPVVQAYFNYRMIHIRTQLNGGLRLRLFEALPGIHRLQQAQGISPNFVHSLDACALQACVCRAFANHGISSFAMIHDDYGTHAANTPALARCLREAFVELYEQNDVLEQLRDSLVAQAIAGAADKGDTIPPTPARGSLNIKDVLNSTYFFA